MFLSFDDAQFRTSTIYQIIVSRFSKKNCSNHCTWYLNHILLQLSHNSKNKQVQYFLIGPETKKSRRWIKCQSSHMSNKEKQAQQKSSKYQKVCFNSFRIYVINIVDFAS